MSGSGSGGALAAFDTGSTSAAVLLDEEGERTELLAVNQAIYDPPLSLSVHNASSCCTFPP